MQWRTCAPRRGRELTPRAQRAERSLATSPLEQRRRFSGLRDCVLLRCLCIGEKLLVVVRLRRLTQLDHTFAEIRHRVLQKLRAGAFGAQTRAQERVCGELSMMINDRGQISRTAAGDM